MRFLQLSFLPVSIVVALLLTGCGYNTGNGGSPPPTGPSPAPPTPAITLQVGAASYQKTDTILVTIKNQSQQTISFTDHQTNCTVIRLEHYGASSWEQAAPCKLLIATRLHALQAGQSLDVKLMAPGQWPSGRYRARLDYAVGSTMGSAAPIVLSSSEFGIS